MVAIWNIKEANYSEGDGIRDHDDDDDDLSTQCAWAPTCRCSSGVEIEDKLLIK